MRALNLRVHRKIYLYILTAFLVFTLHTSVNGQISEDNPGNRIVSVSGSNVTLLSVLKSIEKQTGFRFNYGGEINSRERVTIKQDNKTLTEVLSLLFSPKGYSWKFIDKNIFLIKVNHGNNSGDQKKAENSNEQYVVNGFVTNEKGKPLSGVSIGIVGSGGGTVSDDYGNFQLRNLQQDQELLVSFIGFETKRVRLHGENQLNIALSMAEENLDAVEIISTGYQSIPRERATGSFAQVNNELYNRKVSSNVLDRIYDVTSGLSFMPNRIVGSPTTGSSNFTIRGISTINSSMQPLIVVDGFPYDGNISNLNPNDVESVTVLKDAASASIWGVKAGNGVVVITTKQAKFNQKTKIQFVSNVTVVDPPDLDYIKSISSSEIVELQKSLFARGDYNAAERLTQLGRPISPIPPAVEVLIKQRDGLITQQEAELQLTAMKNHDVNDDIKKYLQQKGIVQQYAINFTGGGTNYKYYASVGHDRDRSTSVGDRNDRTTIRLDNTYKIGSKLEVNGYIVYVQSNVKNSSVQLGFPNGSGFLAPYTKLADENGNSLAIPVQNLRSTYADTSDRVGLLNWQYHPLDEINNKNISSRTVDSRVGTALKYAFLPYLNLEVRYQYQNANLVSNTNYSPESFFARDLINRYTTIDPMAGNIYAIPLGGILDVFNSNQKAWNFRTQVNFDKVWKKHGLIGIIGTEIRQTDANASRNRTYGYNSATNQGQPVDYRTQFTIFPGNNTATVPYIDANTGTLSRYRSYYTNLAYRFDDIYTLTASGRIDGSNFFGVKANQRRVPLWSLGAGWEVSKNDFYKIEWLPYLKMRATYGYNGNTNNSAAAYPTIGFSTNDITKAIVAYLVSPPNPQLRWEKVQVSNFGVDFSFKKSIISGSVEYYLKKGLDLISAISVDPTTGLGNYIGNNADIKGKGVDVTINARPVSLRSFNWFTTFLLSYTSEKVTNYEAKPTSTDDFLTGFGAANNVPPIKDRPLYSIFAYKWAGLDPNTGAARAYVDKTAADYNTVISSAQESDLEYMGPALPRIFGSFRNSFEIHNLTLSFNITYKLKYFFRRTSLSYSNLFSKWGGHSDYLDRWQKPGDELSTDVPSLLTRANAISSDRVYSNSNILVEKGDHIRLQDIRISYNLKQIMRFLPGSNIQIYGYVNNLGILWRANKKGIDPDFGENTIPNPRSYAIGVNVSL